MTIAGIIIGSAGSGKSTIARQLARRHQAALLDKDCMFAELVSFTLAAYGEPDDRDSPFYCEQVRPLEYSAMMGVASDNLALGTSVIIDAPFAAFLNQPDYLTSAIADACWPAVPTVVAYVATAPEVIRHRLVKRGLARDEWKLKNWEQFWATVGSIRPTWRGVPVVEINNDTKPDFSAWDAIIDDS